MTRYRTFSLLAVMLALATACDKRKASAADTAEVPENISAKEASTPSKSSTGAVVVRIDDSIDITESEVDALAAAMLRSQGIPGSAMEQMLPQARSFALEQMIYQKLLVRAADAAGIEVSDEDVTTFVKSQVPEGVTMAMVAERQGMSESELLKDLRNNLKVNRLIDSKVKDQPAPSEAEIKELFEEVAKAQPDFLQTGEKVEARHILVSVKPDASEEDRTAARAKIDGLRKQLLEGGDFAALAKEHSDCPSGKQNGGNLGSFGRGQMVKPFEDAAFSQEVDAVGDVVTTDFGFHIVQVLKKEEGKTRTVESEKDQLVQLFMRRKKDEMAQNYVEELKGAAKIENLSKDAASTPSDQDGDAESAHEAEPRELPKWAK